MDEVIKLLKAIQHAQEATHAELIGFKSDTIMQFKKINEEFGQVHKKLDDLDSEIRSLKRQHRHMNTDIDAALDRIELIERTINQPTV